jgi:hypothetical protein
MNTINNTSDAYDVSNVNDTKWATRVRALSADERTNRLELANGLLAHPEDISTPLETELYILCEQLQGK